MNRLLIALLLLLHVSLGQEIRVGSKLFTESVILGEILTLTANSVGLEAEHIRQLGGTRILWEALLKGQIDTYPEYTGTLFQEVLAGENLRSMKDLKQHLTSLGIQMTDPIGFNNTYALGMKRRSAEELGIRRISDLQAYPDLSFGFSNEFMDRGDGWPSLRAEYILPQTDVKGIDHALAYQGIDSDKIDVIDLYTTDAEIDFYDLVALEDDQNHFPRYQAVILYRESLAESHPDFLQNLKKLENSISASQMIAMNKLVKLDGRSEIQVATEFINERLKIELPQTENRSYRELGKHIVDHLVLFGISLTLAIGIGIPLGVFSVRNPKTGQVILGIAGIFQTIPSLALLVLTIPLLGIGFKPAILALFLYSLLPIIRNTVNGFNEIPKSLLDSAKALGLPSGPRLTKIELPLAVGNILTGIKTAAVINIGTATLGALIGAGGLGQPILTGIRLNDMQLILMGAIPAALLALGIQGIFEILGNLLVPKGLRIR